MIRTLAMAYSKTPYIMIHEAWEKKFSRLDVLLDGDKLRFYPYCEVSRNTELFHLDIQKKGRKNFGSRYIVTDVMDVIPFLKAGRLNISLQIRQGKGDTECYQMLQITEIISAVDEHKQDAFIYRCSNGKSYIRSIFANSEEDLFDKEVIYKRE